MLVFPSPPVKKLDFSDALLVPKLVNDAPLDIGSREDIKITAGDNDAVPVIVANMDFVGTFDVARIVQEYGVMTAIGKGVSLDQWAGVIRSGHIDMSKIVPVTGANPSKKEIEKLSAIVDLCPEVPFVCIDVANGYLKMVCDTVSLLKKELGSVPLCAGNIVEETGMAALHGAGADIVKVGIGSGGVCLTRKQTGVGYPQLSAIHDLFEKADKLGVKMVSDGGVKVPGDVVKALSAGASFVMSGSYFAGHEETGTKFHGMSSDASRKNRGEAVRAYRASEGRSVVLDNKGSLHDTLRNLTGGLRSACAYLQKPSMEDLLTDDIHAVEVNNVINRISGVLTETEDGC